MGKRVGALKGLRCLLLIIVLAAIIPRVFAIMVPALLNSKYEILGNRSAISDGIVDNYNERSEVSRAMPCIESYLRMHFRHPDRISVFIAETVHKMSSIFDSFLHGLQSNVISYLINGYLDPMANYNTSASAVILTENISSLENISSSYIYLCGRDCRFAVIMTNSFEDVESFLLEADNVVQLMWSTLVGKVVVVARVRDAVLVAGSLSFVQGEICTPMAPVLLGRCENEYWQIKELHPKLSMNGCISNLGFFENLPYSTTKNDTIDLTGIEGIMMQEVMKRLNANGEFVQVAWTNDIFEELEMEFNVSGGYEVIFGGIIWKPEDRIDFTVPYTMSRILWMIPITPNVSFRGLIAPLSAKTWIAVAMALLFGAVVKSFFIREVTFLDIFAIVLGSSTATQPHRVSSRIYYLSWVLFAFLLSQFYLATLALQLMNEDDTRIQSLQELVASGMKLGGLYEVKELFEVIDDTDDDTEEDDLINYINDNFIVFERDEYLDRLADLKAGRNTSLALLVITNVTTTRSNVEFSNAYMTKESLANYPLAPAVRRGLPYLHRINQKILALVEGGFIDFWATTVDVNERYYKDNRGDPISTEMLGLKQLIPGFLLLAIGYGLGGIILIAEIIVYPSKWLK